MGVFDEMRRRAKDAFAKDEQITRPMTGIRDLEKTVLTLTPAIRQQEYDRVMDNAKTYHNGRHNEQIPVEVLGRLHALNRRIDRLNEVEAARDRQMKRGGPPTKNTIAEAVHKSFMERNKQYELIQQQSLQKATSKTAAKEAAKEHSHTQEVHA
jgi:hypothetical protein